MAPHLRFVTVERGLAQAQVAGRRTPQAGEYSSTTLAESDSPLGVLAPVIDRRDTISNPDGGQSAVNVPSLTGTRALAGIIVFLGIVVLGIAGWRLRIWWHHRAPKSKSKTSHLRSLSLCESPLPEKIVSEKRNPLYTQTLIDFGYGFNGMPALEKAHLRKDSSSSLEEMTAKWVPQIKPTRPGRRARDSLDLIPRPFSGLLPPAPTVQRSSRLAQFASAIVGSPKPSVSSFDKVPPYSSRSSSPLTVPRETTAPAVAPSAPSVSSSQPAKQEKGAVPGRSQPVTKHTSARALPSRTDAPKGKLPRVPVPKADPPPPITVAGVTQKLLAAEKTGTHGSQPLKSPTRVDSIRRDKRTKPTRSIASVLLVAKPSNPFSSAADPESSSKTVDTGFPRSPTTPSVESSESSGSLTISQSSHEPKLPRLVIVIHLFKPSMPDELPIRRGEVLRMTDEFKDGWCAVQRLSSTTGKSETGVVPRMCVADGPTFDPSPSVSLKSRFSSSTVYSHSSSSTTYTKAFEPLRTPSPVPHLPS